MTTPDLSAAPVLTKKGSDQRAETETEQHNATASHTAPAPQAAADSSAVADSSAAANSGTVAGSDTAVGSEPVREEHLDKTISLLEEAATADVFALTDEQLAHLKQPATNTDGFRLERVDVYNWGSFNNNVKSVYFGGQNVLMTGDNGAGKSSIIDAITVLLYDLKKVVFNQAAGAEKGERNLASYVLGLYKNDNTSGIKTEMGLRSGQNAVLSIIMASFYNRKLNEHVILLQGMVMLKNKTSPNRYYFIGNRDFNLQQDILPVKDIRELGQKLRQIGCTRYEQFNEYYSQMQRIFGIEGTKVLDLFYKTISMKSISNISDFVRKQMLEDFNGDELVEQLIDRFNDLDASYKSVEEAQRQVEALKPICSKGEEYKTNKGRLAFISDCRLGAGPVLYGKKAELIQEQIDLSQGRLDEVEGQLLQTKGKIEDLSAKIMSTNQEIALKGGNRHELLKRDIRLAQRERDDLFASFQNYIRMLHNVNLEAITDERGFKAVQAKLPKMLTELNQTLEQHDENVTQKRVELRTVQDEFDSCEAELNSLRSRPSKIPSEFVTLRARMCEAIGCDEHDLPYVGELIQLKSEEKAQWENAAEKLLRGFGLTMLVPEQYYPEVVHYTNHNNLRMRLKFERIKENDFAAGEAMSVSGGQTAMGAALSSAFGASGSSLANRARLGASSLPRKLEIKQEPRFYNYIRQCLEARYNYVCTDDESVYRQEKYALMPSGLAKSGGSNVKDDRRGRTDYILGWSNEDKIAQLEQEQQNRKITLSGLRDTLRQLDLYKKSAQNNVNAVRSLQLVTSFSKIDYMSKDEELVRLNAELEELMRSSNVLEVLKQRLEDYEKEKRVSESMRDALTMNQGKLRSDLDKLNRELSAALTFAAPAQSLSTEQRSAINTLIAASQERLRMDKLQYDQVDILIQEVTLAIDSHIKSLQARDHQLAQDLVNLQSNFTQTFVVAGRNLDPTRAEAWEGFKEFLAKLEHDDLPRFVSAFKDKLNRETIEQFGSLHAALQSQSRKIKERIVDINTIMRDVDFNPDHYIQMVATESPDQEIRQFRHDLRNCTSNMLDNDWTLEDADKKFHEVKALIDRFKGEVNGADIDGRWRKKVTDVKEWFEFSASEHSRQDDSQVDYYEDSGGKSGGQKEKLAYTVLASSLAYQYRSKMRAEQENAPEWYVAPMSSGADLYRYHDRSYRFVIIDEAFGRGSPQSVDYALTLFSKFNLQLLVATPMQKLDIIEKYVKHVAFVYRDEDTHESTVVNYDLRDYILKRNLKERLSKVPLQAASTREATKAQLQEQISSLDERIHKEQAKFSGPQVGTVNKSTAPKDSKMRPQQAAPATVAATAADAATDTTTAADADTGSTGEAGTSQSAQGAQSTQNVQSAQTTVTAEKPLVEPAANAAALAESEPQAPQASPATAVKSAAGSDGLPPQQTPEQIAELFAASDLVPEAMSKVRRRQLALEESKRRAEQASSKAAAQWQHQHQQAASSLSQQDGTEPDAAGAPASGAVLEPNADARSHDAKVAGSLTVRDENGNYLSVDEFSRKMAAERREQEQLRTAEAMSRLDYLDNLLRHDGGKEDRAEVDTTAVTEASASGENAADSVQSEEQAVKSKGKTKRHKEEAEEPHYKHSLEELLVEEEE